MNILNFFTKKYDDFTIPERNVNPLFILDKDTRDRYSKYGYVVIKNVVDDISIKKITDTFESITKMPEYFESDKFLSTVVFGEKISKIALDAINDVSPNFFPTILDSNLCKYDFGGAIIIKNKGCWFEPHQDSPVIDEYTGVTAYAWIPTVDMTSENGTFYALTGSHLWAAWQRSSQGTYWPLKKNIKFLWNQMEPVVVKKGDLLLFDSGLIHASAENKTNKIRLAFNLCIIEKKATLIQYVNEKETPKNCVEKYFVDELFWKSGNFLERPKAYERVIEKVRYPSKITETFLANQISRYKNI